VIRLKPTIIASYYNRALARYHLGDLAGSSSDLTHLLETQGPSVRPFLLRSKVRTKMGDRDGGRLDRERALAAEPRDEQDWTARGLERQERDPTGALSDFDRALALNPGYLSALQNKANVLAEDLGRTDEAVATLDRALELYPRSVPARAGRGVLLARLGRRDAAHRDARESLKTDDSPFFTYQVSGIYALTSRQVSEDRNEAFRLLKLAFSHGFGLDLVETDHDLDAIRADPEFQVLVSRARADRARAHPAAANKPTNLPNGSN
jgi:tetratricopeptide (TPR) repeat protein